MATLLIPDIHERLDRLEVALRGRIEKADRVVFLGDWFDAFGPFDRERFRQICAFLNQNAAGVFYEPEDGEEPGRLIPATFLLGNHDCHYFFRHNAFKCSGYDPRKQALVDDLVAPETIKRFVISTRVGPYLVSHAGYTEVTLQYCRPEVEIEAIGTALAGGFDPLFGAGYDRGGDQLVGGPTWLDWSNLQHIPDCAQIVGHSNGRDVRVKGGLGVPHNSYCLDTALRHCAWVDDTTGAVTIEMVG